MLAPLRPRPFQTSPCPPSLSTSPHCFQSPSLFLVWSTCSRPLTSHTLSLPCDLQQVHMLCSVCLIVLKTGRVLTTTYGSHSDNLQNQGSCPSVGPARPRAALNEPNVTRSCLSPFHHREHRSQGVLTCLPGLLNPQSCRQRAEAPVPGSGSLLTPVLPDMQMGTRSLAPDSGSRSPTS